MTRQVALITLLALLAMILVLGVPASAEEQSNARYANREIDDPAKEAEALDEDIAVSAVSGTIHLGFRCAYCRVDA